MTRVDFYVLQSDLYQDRHQFACKLTEKAFKQGNKILLATSDEQESHLINDMLWDFSPQSFVPHSMIGDQDVPDEPVLISHSDDIRQHHDVMINLRKNTPGKFSRFHRLAEIVIQDDEILTATRKNFGFYKSRGYPINTHKLGK